MSLGNKYSMEEFFEQKIFPKHLEETFEPSGVPISEKDVPRRFRVPTNKHPNGSDSKYQYGCYFPLTDLVVGDMGGRGTGKPTGVEWIDVNQP